MINTNLVGHLDAFDVFSLNQSINECYIEDNLGRVGKGWQLAGACLVADEARYMYCSCVFCVFVFVCVSKLEQSAVVSAGLCERARVCVCIW